VAAAGAGVLAAAGLLVLHPAVSHAAPALNSNALYVAPGGSSSASGSQSDPTTLDSAVTRIGSGGTIYMRGGTYNLSQTVVVAAGNNGSSGSLKEISAYPGESPVLDFSAQSESSSNRGLSLNGNYWHVYGITVQHAGDNGISIGGSHNVVERVVTAFNRDSGLQISRADSATSISGWPSDNLVVSSESHDNADSDGEDADGFAAKLTVGTGNVFRYDVSHNNIDDGWDLYTKTETGPIGPVTIENSLSYDNGTLSNGGQAGSGDRNGFKLGGDDIKVNHIVRDNIAYHNGHHGFTYNSNPGSMTIDGNTSIDNTERNFSFDEGSSTFTGNTSCRFEGDGSNDKTVGTVGSGNQFWSGSNGSRCSSYDGALGWSFASDGSLDVTFGGTHVTGGTTSGSTNAGTTTGSTNGGSSSGTTNGGTTTGTTSGSTNGGTSSGTTDGGTSSGTSDGGTSSGSTTGGTGTSSCTVTVTPNSWPGGFVANLTVKNNGSSAVNGWHLGFTLPSGQTITSAWSADISPSSGSVTATNVSYNAQIPAGGSQSFGFQGTYSGSYAQPGSFSLNGTACSIG
jgi:hypothetical protein